MIPIVHLGRFALVLTDVAAWAVVHTATGYAVHRAPASWFASDTWLTRERGWERDGRWYEHVRIRSWKDRLPEAGALFAGGVSKRHLPSGDEGMVRFAVETRRAEWGHWLAAAGALPFVLWNPPVLAAVMLAYGLAVNAPFIAIQRYNRLRTSRVISRRARTASLREDAAARSRNDRGTTGNSIP